MVKRWIVVGALAMAGMKFALERAVIAGGIRSEWALVGTAFASAFAVGTLMVAHATMRPQREPLLAAIAVGAIAVARWLQVLRGDHLPWLLALALALCAGAVAGGVVGRRFRIRAPGPGLTLLLAIGVAMGLVVTVRNAQVLLGDLVKNDVAMYVLGIVLIFGGPALTQSVVPVRRIWLCGLGTLGLLAILVSRANWTTLIGLSSVGFIMWPLGALGARIAWRYTGARAPTTPELPDARAR